MADDGLDVGKGNAVVDVGWWFGGLEVGKGTAVDGFDVTVATGFGVGTESVGE